MIGTLNVKCNAQNPNMALSPIFAHIYSPSSIRVIDVPKKIGSWKITTVNLQATYPDNAIYSIDCVQTAGAWVGTIPASKKIGKSANGFQIKASGIDENGNAVENYILGVGDIYILDADSRIVAGESATVMHLLSAQPAEAFKGDIAYINGSVEYYDGEKWINFAGQNEYATSSNVSTIVEGYGYATPSDIDSKVDELSNSLSDSYQAKGDYVHLSGETWTGYDVNPKFVADGSLQIGSSNVNSFDRPSLKFEGSEIDVMVGQRGGDYTKAGILYATYYSNEEIFLRNQAAKTYRLGGIKIGFTKNESEHQYPVELDDNSRAYVTVPWTDVAVDSARYDAATHKIVITFNDTSKDTISVDVGDLVDTYTGDNDTIEVKNNVISVKKDYALSADITNNFYDKTTIDSKLDEAGKVKSVNGQTGDVTIEAVTSANVSSIVWDDYLTYMKDTEEISSMEWDVWIEGGGLFWNVTTKRLSWSIGEDENLSAETEGKKYTIKRDSKGVWYFDYETTVNDEPFHAYCYPKFYYWAYHYNSDELTDFTGELSVQILDTSKTKLIDLLSTLQSSFEHVTDGDNVLTTCYELVTYKSEVPVGFYGTNGGVLSDYCTTPCQTGYLDESMLSVYTRHEYVKTEKYMTSADGMLMLNSLSDYLEQNIEGKGFQTSADVSAMISSFHEATDDAFANTVIESARSGVITTLNHVTADDDHNVNTYLSVLEDGTITLITTNNTYGLIRRPLYTAGDDGSETSSGSAVDTTTKVVTNNMISAYALSADVSSQIGYIKDVLELVNGTTSSDAFSNYYTKGEVDSKLSSSSSSEISAYALSADVSANYQPKGDYLTEHQSLSDYYKKSETSSATEINLALDNYALSANVYNKTEIDDMIGNVNTILEGLN